MQKTYETYKDSGIEWIGVVPSHWSICQFKRLHCGSNVGESIDKQYWINDNQGYIFYTAGIKPINTNYINFPKEKYTKENDLLLARNGTPYVYLPAINAVYTDHIIRVSIKSTADKKYIYYALSKSISNEVVDTVSIATWSASLWNAQYLPIPPFSEQQAIAEYLDKNCSKIDALIAELEQQVTDLGTMKKAEISRVVTKGLNPDAPLKYSGIEWIGEVPKHWKCLKISWIFNTIGSGTTPKSDDPTMYSDDGFYWLQTGDLNDGYVNNTTKRITEKASSISSLTIYPKGSLVIALYGATIGKLGILNIDSATNQACCVLNDSSIMVIKYAFYMLMASKSALLEKSVGGGQPNISQDIIRRHKVTCPPISEQQAIAEYLDTYCAKVDATVKELQDQIADLKLYKQSIISEAVTGKIKVID